MSRDGKLTYVNVEKAVTQPTVWKIDLDGSAAELLCDACGFVTDASLDGKYLLSTIILGEHRGIYLFRIADKQLTMLVPDVASFEPRFSRDGKSVLYTLSSKGEVILFRVPWSDGKAIEPPSAVMKLPFGFPQNLHGNAYDVARDLSKIVHIRPSGQYDFYLLSRN